MSSSCPANQAVFDRYRLAKRASTRGVMEAKPQVWVKFGECHLEGLSACLKDVLANCQMTPERETGLNQVFAEPGRPTTYPNPGSSIRQTHPLLKRQSAKTWGKTFISSAEVSEVVRKSSPVAMIHGWTKLALRC